MSKKKKTIQNLNAHNSANSKWVLWGFCWNKVGFVWSHQFVKTLSSCNVKLFLTHVWPCRGAACLNIYFVIVPIVLIINPYRRVSPGYVGRTLNGYRSSIVLTCFQNYWTWPLPCWNKASAVSPLSRDLFCCTCTEGLPACSDDYKSPLWKNLIVRPAAQCQCSVTCT